MADSRQGGSVLVVVPATGDRKKIFVALRYMQKDEAFFRWFSGLRNLDTEDLRNSANAIAANSAFGATPEDRLRRLVLARKVGRALDIATLAVTAWCFVAPRPYALLIATLAVLPVLAFILVILSRGLFRINTRRTEVHVNLSTVFALPCCVLLARLLLDLDMVDWVPTIIAAVVGAVVLVGMIALVERSLRTRPGMLLGCSLLAGAYTFGVIGQTNALVDRSQPSVFRGPVLDKHVTYGKTTTYQLRLAPWGLRNEPGDVSVSHALFDALQLADQACVLMYPGALGMPWFIVLGG